MTIIYAQLEPEKIQSTQTNEDGSTTSGLLYKVDADWQKPNGEIVDLSGEAVTWLDEAAYLAEQAAALVISTFKTNRQSLMDASTVTVATHVFDADEKSIARMTEKLIAESLSLDTKAIDWVLAGSTGVKAAITLGNLRDAHKDAVEYRDSIWFI
jgi:hypothetical protein